MSAQKTKQQLIVENNEQFPNNNTNFISPARLRGFNRDMIESVVVELDFDVFEANTNSALSSLDGRVTVLEGEVDSIQALTGSLATTGSNTFNGNQVVNGNVNATSFTGDGSGLTNLPQVNTGSLLVTASAAGNTITFTKGDTSTFDVTVAGTTVNTGSFVTTSSFNAYTSSTDSRLTSLEIATGSLSASITSLNAFTASQSALNTTFATTGSNTFVGDQTISGSVSLNFLDFNTSFTATQPTAGRLSWNSSDGTLDLGLKGGNVTLQLGQETLYEVRNSTGTTIAKGTSLYASGATEGSGRITAAPFTADGSIREVRFLGLANESILNGVNGFVSYFGYVRGLDTRGTASTPISVGGETWAVGDILYAHPTVAGKLTNVRPKHEIIVAIVIIRNQTSGVLFVRPASYGHLDDIHDVLINTGSLSTGDLLVYDSGSDYWINTKQLNGPYVITGSLTATSFTGSYTGSFTGDGSGLTNLPVPSINTGSLATTGSNTFVGNQTVSGSVTATSFTGSYTGSFTGDGSGLTGVTSTPVPTWTDFATRWDTPPTFVSASVLGYTWESVTRYRFVPTPYTASQDAFYSDLGLTQLIVARGN
jgi:fibronectin-binding autotransporter adhesin